VGQSNPADKPAIAAGSPGALVSVPQFGGNRGGKKRHDGLPPGSIQAKEADRKRDAERKRQDREEKRRLAEPPPLPSAVAPPGNTNGAAPGVEGANGVGPSAPLAAPIQWQPEMLREFTDEIVNAIEQSRVAKFSALMREGGLPDLLVKRVAQDSHYPAGSKRAVQIATPRVACKWLNKAGLSAEYADEVALVTALGSILIQGRKLQSQLESLIEQFRKAKEQNAQNQSGPNQNGQSIATSGGPARQT
jgi:hypothetical protein